MKNMLLALFASTLILSLSACAPAYANDTELIPTDIGNIVDFVTGIVFIFISVVASFIAERVLSYVEATLSIKIDDSTREYFYRALDNAIGYGQTLAQQTTKDRSQLEIENDIVRGAIGYLNASVPDALEHFQFDETKLENLIRARLNKA